MSTFFFSDRSHLGLGVSVTAAHAGLLILSACVYFCFATLFLSRLASSAILKTALHQACEQSDIPSKLSMHRIFLEFRTTQNTSAIPQYTASLF